MSDASVIATDLEYTAHGPGGPPHVVKLGSARGNWFQRTGWRHLIGIIALREKRPQDAQKLLAELARDYPSNPLFRKELSKLNTKLGLSAN